MNKTTHTKTTCYHCGEVCAADATKVADKIFCCMGCRTVYDMLNKNGLCSYYNLNEQPGLNQKLMVRPGKFACLEDATIAKTLIVFSDEDQTQAVFYLPQIHCSSCLWLLENLHKINGNIQNSRVDFIRKELTVLFANKKISLKQIAETLASIGYEPHISLQQLSAKAKAPQNKSLIYKLGVAGFCFSNIMLISFPEYFSLEGFVDKFQMASIFRTLNLLLSLPVFFYSATEFYTTAWKGLQHRFLNIDAPIVLAIFITFGRSLFEIIAGTGAGYLDSMSGIVFFMLVGRVLQDRTNQSLTFTRDYTSYFPIAVNKMVDGKEIPTPLPELKTGDSILIHDQEIIPADGMLVRGHAAIDYSFVTGESLPQAKQISEIIYAGGRQTAGNIELLLIKDVSQSYLTNLWNKASMQTETDPDTSFVHQLSRYFTAILFTIAFATAMYWWAYDASKIWPSVTAVLIVACPCALLLSNSFTSGHMLKWFDRGKFYLRNAVVLEKIASANHIVFDKTGTLTDANSYDITYAGDVLNDQQKQLIASVAAQNNHPLSKAVFNYLNCEIISTDAFKEITGKGCEAWINDHHVIIGKPGFVFKNEALSVPETVVAIKINRDVKGFFIIKNKFKTGVAELIEKLQLHYPISIISGDNDGARSALKTLTHSSADLLFLQSPEDKLNYIESLQKNGKKVMMIGDGLNDAGALKQSDAGIAVTENVNNFSPACDGIIDGAQLIRLPQFIHMARASKRIVIASFVLSILYNIIGLSFAVSGTLQPIVAAILMPASSISIVLFTWAAAQISNQRFLQNK